MTTREYSGTWIGRVILHNKNATSWSRLSSLNDETSLSSFDVDIFIGVIQQNISTRKIFLSGRTDNGWEGSAAVQRTVSTVTVAFLRGSRRVGYGNGIGFSGVLSTVCVLQQHPNFSRSNFHTR